MRCLGPINALDRLICDSARFSPVRYYLCAAKMSRRINKGVNSCVRPGDLPPRNRPVAFRWSDIGEAQDPNCPNFGIETGVDAERPHRQNR